MAINKKLIHFGTRANFDKELAAGNILDTSIVFIKDAKLIWTHGQYYGYDSVSGDLKDRLDNIEEIIEENEFVTAKALTELEETKANISDTLEGYGITDAYTKEDIDNKNFYVKPSGGITKDDLADSIKISLENADNYKGTVTGVKINNGTAKNPTSGIVNLEISKSTVGLGNVDNTADANKNVKSAISAEKDSNGNIISETYAKSASLKTVATSGSYNDLTDKPESLKNPESLTIQANGTTLNTYDGSSAKTINITASNLGLSSALKYCGITTTALTDGSSTNPVKINNTNHTATTGCVVFYGDKEFIFNGSVWEEFGYPVDMSSYATTTWVNSNYKPKQTAVNSPTASGNTTAFIDTISQDADGKITVTKKNINFSGYKTTQTAVSSPSASGNATAFIDTISQNSNGVISVTKKNIDLSQYLKKSDTDGNDISLPSDFEASTYPENTGNGVFTELVPGESLSSAIQTLDKNLVEIVEETLKNEKVTAQGLSELSTVKANVSDLSAVAFSGSYNDLTDQPNIPNSLKNPYSLTIQANGTNVCTYDGSVSKTANITASSLGLASALKYCGITTTNLVDDSTASTVVINGSNHTATTGCVVFYGDKEFVYNGSKWEELGYPIDLKISNSFATTEYGGNIEFNSITKGDSFDTAFNKVESNISDLADKLADNEQVISASLVDLDGRVSKKQDTLVSGTNIKTINGEDILGDGDITIKGGGSSNIQGLLNIRDITSLETVWNSLTENGETATYIITDPEGNYPSPNVETVYIDSDDLWLDLFYRANGNALKFLIKAPEAYYQVLGNTWSSQTISNYIRLPKPHLQTAKVGDLVTIARQEFTAQEFYSKYIDYNSINFRESLPILEKEAFNLWLSSKGISTSLSDGKIIEQMIIKGLVYSCLTDPEVTGDTPIPLSINEKVVLYTAHITPNTQNIYSGEFWTGNMTGAGIYSYINNPDPAIPDREDGEMYTGYVSPDGTQTLVSMKNPFKAYKKVNNAWEKLETDTNYKTRYGWGTSLDSMLKTGVCAYTPATVAGMDANWTIFVTCSSDGDPTYYHLMQTAICRNDDKLGRIFQRMGWYKGNGEDLHFTDWKEVGGGSSDVQETYHGSLNIATNTLELNDDIKNLTPTGFVAVYSSNNDSINESASSIITTEGFVLIRTTDYCYGFSKNEDGKWVLGGNTPNYSERFALKDDLSGKQNTISDLEIIRQGAALGKTALQYVPSNYATKDDLATAIANAITTTLNTPV